MLGSLSLPLLSRLRYTVCTASLYGGTRALLLHPGPSLARFPSSPVNEELIDAFGYQGRFWRVGGKWQPERC